MRLLLLYLSRVDHLVPLAYQKGWNGVIDHNRRGPHPHWRIASTRHRELVRDRRDHRGANKFDFTSGWNAAVFYCLQLGHNPPRLHNRTMRPSLVAAAAAAAAAVGEDLVVMYT